MDKGKILLGTAILDLTGETSYEVVDGRFACHGDERALPLPTQPD
jgi:hypothetical protein